MYLVQGEPLDHATAERLEMLGYEVVTNFTNGLSFLSGAAGLRFNGERPSRRRQMELPSCEIGMLRSVVCRDAFSSLRRL